MNSPDNIIKYAIFYCLMFAITWISKLRKSNRLFDSSGILAKNKVSLIILHLAGIVLLGLLPLALSKQVFNMIVSPAELPAAGWQLLFIFFMAMLIFTGFNTGHKIELNENSSPVLSGTFLMFYFPVRVLFLCAYEIFFRGILLFDGLKWWGIFPAILLGIGLTVLIHLFTNKKEMWGCIPFGIMLSICCIAFNAVWPAIVLHVALSMAYELPRAQQYLTQLKPAR